MSRMKQGTRIGATDSTGNEICVGDVLRHSDSGSEVRISDYGTPVSTTSHEKVVIMSFTEWTLVKEGPAPTEHDELVKLEKENAALIARNKELEGQVKSLQDDCQGLDKFREELEAQLQETIEHNTEVKAVLFKCQKEKAEVEQRLRTLQTEHNNLAANFKAFKEKSANNEEMVRLRKEVEELTALKEGHIKEIQELNALIDEFDAEIKRLSGEHISNDNLLKELARRGFKGELVQTIHHKIG